MNTEAEAECSMQNGGTAYPWKSPQADLAEARHLIYKHGHLRRMKGLQNTEAALQNRRQGGELVNAVGLAWGEHPIYQSVATMLYSLRFQDDVWGNPCAGENIWSRELNLYRWYCVSAP